MVEGNPVPNVRVVFTVEPKPIPGMPRREAVIFQRIEVATPPDEEQRKELHDALADVLLTAADIVRNAHRYEPDDITPIPGVTNPS